MVEMTKNTQALRQWASDRRRGPLRLPLGNMASSGAVARTLGELDDGAAKKAYAATLEARDEAGAAGFSERDMQVQDGLELGRRALSHVLARRGLRNPSEMAVEAMPMVSDRGAHLSGRQRLDPGNAIQEGNTGKHAEFLESQKRSFMDRLMNRPLGVSQVQVVDGDSIKVNGDAEARLHGIDAPEMPGKAGQAAKDHLESIVRQGSAMSVQPHGKDHHGRHLVTLYAGDENVNRRMVSDGFARAYGRYSKKYWAAQAGAAMKGKGLWAKGWLKHPEGQRHKKAGAER